MIVLSPINDPSHVPGTEQIVASCGHMCWIAPSGVEIRAKNPDMESVCVPCHDKRASSEDEVEVHIQPRQVREIAQRFNISEDIALAFAKSGVVHHYKELGQTNIIFVLDEE